MQIHSRVGRGFCWEGRELAWSWIWFVCGRDPALCGLFMSVAFDPWKPIPWIFWIWLSKPLVLFVAWDPWIWSLGTKRLFQRKMPVRVCKCQGGRKAKGWVTLKRLSWLASELCEVSAGVAGYEVKGMLGMSSGPIFPESTPFYGGHPVTGTWCPILWVH